MRTLLIIVAASLLFAACADPASDVTEPVGTNSAPVVTSPVTTSPVTTSPAAGGDTVDPADGESTVTTNPPKEPVVTPTTESAAPGPSGQVAAAVADLADRLDVDETAITVVSVEEVTWPDGSLGCPQPGMRYTQQVVNGTLIVLEADGVRYEYHSGVGRNPFYCADPTGPATGDFGDI